MSVAVKFFAGLRESLGRSHCHLDVEASLTVLDVWQQAADGEPLPPGTLCAINKVYAESSASVEDGDEVAFFPPVTGG